MMQDLLSIIVSLTATLLPPGCMAVGADTRPVQVTITAATEAGVPLVGAPFQAVSMSGVAFGRSDGAGRVTLTVDVDRGEAVMVTRLWDGKWHDIPIADRVAAEQEYNTLRRQYSFKTKQLTTMTPGADAYSIEWIAYPTVTVSGRLVDAGGTPLAGSVACRERLAFDQVGPDGAGAFHVAGVRTGVEANFYFQRRGASQVHSLHLPGELLLNDADIGDLLIDDLPCDIPATISMSEGTDLFDSALSALIVGVTLVRADGHAVLNFPADDTGRVRRDRWREPPLTPLLPAGDWYVAPGLFPARPGTALHRGLLAGRQAQFDAAGVPKLTVVAGQPATFTFNARTTYEAIISVAGDLAE